MKQITRIATLLLAGFTAAHAEQYYKKADALFSMRPDPGQTVNHLTEFGPVGMSLDLVKPNFIIRVKDIEPGSPAEKTGEFKPGTIIHSINGETLRTSTRETEWGRETYYSLRVLFKAGRADKALEFTRKVLDAQIFGPPGPYPDEDAIDMLCPGNRNP